MAGLTSKLFRAARASATAKAATSGSSRKMARRGKNIGIGRLLARGGFWNWLFGGRR